MKLKIVALLAGEVLVTGGLWFIYPPAAAIILGLQVVAFALLSGDSE